MSAMIAASAAARRALARESSESENSAYHARLTHATSESPAAGASVRSNDCVAKNAKSATIAASHPAARRIAIDSEASATMTMMPFDQASRLPTGVSGRARSATTAARSTMPEHVAASASTTGRRVQTIASVAPIAIETAAATPASRPQTDRRARCRNARNSVLGYTPSGAWTRIDVLVSAPARACGRARSRRAPRPVPQPSVRAVRADPVRFRSGDLRADGKARQRRTGAAAVHVRAAVSGRRRFLARRAVVHRRAAGSGDAERVDRAGERPDRARDCRGARTVGRDCVRWPRSSSRCRFCWCRRRSAAISSRHRAPTSTRSCTSSSCGCCAIGRSGSDRCSPWDSCSASSPPTAR